METIGLFPLGMVLLPTEVVPLHIFEPRYRELIGECLEEDATFGLLYASDDGLAEIGTRAAVTEVLERFDDGRLNIVVEGRERFRLVALTEGRTYHTGEVEPLDDVPDPADPADVQRALDLFRHLVTLTATELEPPPETEDQLSFAIAARFDFAAEIKLELLSERSERTRLQRLAGLLENAAETIERHAEIAARAQTNGKVVPRG